MGALCKCKWMIRFIPSKQDLTWIGLSRILGFTTCSNLTRSPLIAEHLRTLMSMTQISMLTNTGWLGIKTETESLVSNKNCPLWLSWRVVPQPMSSLNCLFCSSHLKVEWLIITANTANYSNYLWKQSHLPNWHPSLSEFCLLFNPSFRWTLAGSIHLNL